MDQFRSIHQPFFIDHTISELIKLGRLNHIDEQIPTSKQRQEMYKQRTPLPPSTRQSSSLCKNEDKRSARAVLGIK